DGGLRIVAILRSLARLIAQLAEVELALLDRDFDLVDLDARLGELGDGAHQRLARVGERLLMRAHFVAALGALVLELLRDPAQAVALVARAVERARLLVEERLLFGCFRFERRNLRSS